MSTPVKFVGFAEGPTQFIKELGQEVATFMEPTPKPTLKWHVPLEKRGPFRPTDLANYSLESDYRTDVEGYLLCYGRNKAGSRCGKKAVNRYPRCEVHGGGLHPYDKVAKDIPMESEEAQRDSMTRYQEFKAGLLTADDLDDEELAMGGFRSKKNGIIYRPKQVPRELSNAFQRALFERAQQELQAGVVDAARVVNEIFKNKNIEPDIRLKAALSNLERNLGKPNQNVIVTQDKPFEHVFSDLESGTRAQFRGQVVDGSIDSGTSEPIVFDSNTFGGGEYNVNPLDELPSQSEQGNPFAGNAIGEPTNELAIAESRAALSSRNPAILAPFVEAKPFEYDLEDHSEQIKKTTKKRYASRALGVDLFGPSIPLIADVRRLKEGLFVRYLRADEKKIAAQDNSAAKKRKTYTLDDF